MSKSNLGNPIITSLIASKITEKKPVVTGRTESDIKLEMYRAENKRKLKNNIAKGVAGFLIVFATYKVAKKIIKNNTEQNQSLDVQFAKRLRVAMFPSGQTWIPDGTNEKAILDVAYEIVNSSDVEFKDVQKSYKKLYNNSLSDHLQKELNSEEYTRFLTVISNTYNPDKDKENPVYYKEKMVVMTKETSFYHDWDDIYSKQKLKANSFFLNVVATGKVKKVALVGLFLKETRIEIKADNGKTRWLSADGIVTANNTVENKNKLKKKGYTAYIL